MSLTPVVSDFRSVSQEICFSNGWGPDPVTKDWVVTEKVLFIKYYGRIRDGSVEFLF